MNSSRTSVGIWERVLRTGKLTWTPQLEAIFGVEPESVKDYADFRDRVHPDDLAAMEGQRDAAVQRGETFNLEYRIIRPDGQVRWILSVGGASYDEVTREPVRILGNSVDITERKQAELALADRDLQLALASKAGLIGRHTYDVDTEVIQFSPGYAVIHGLPEGTTEIARSEWLALMHPEDAERIHLFRSRAFCEHRSGYNVEYRVVHSSGEVRWIELRTVISYGSDGRPKRVIGVNIDITERKRAEIALQASEAKLAGILAIAGDAIISIDEDHRITLFNKAAERLFGYSQGEMIGQPMDLLIPTRFRRTHDRHIERFTSEPDIPRRMSEQREVPGRRKNGEEFPIEASISKLKVGEEWVCTVVLRDITERKRAEERQRALLAELDHRVKNALSTVSSVVSQTWQVSRSVATFAEALDARIRSMAATHDLLSSGGWQGISLAELVWRELAPYATRDNTEISGPDIVLKSEAGQAMAMVLHELTTNAAKYGALSIEKGRVSIRWDQRPNGHSRSHLVFEWQEVGGPPVEALGKPSYGTTTIRDLIPYEFGGTVDLVLAADGVRAT
jgi:PAS domain S-box-containing protein